MHNTVIFDFDGTLLYTLKDLADAVNYALEKHGYPQHSEKVIQRFVGNGVNLLVARALPQGFDNPEYDKVFADFRDFYSKHCSDNTGPYRGVMELLAGLKAQGRKMAIVTNKYQTAAEELRRQFFADYIPLIVGDLEGRRRKPEPDAVFAAMKELGSAPEDCIYVGDTEVDMQTAANSGIDFAAVAWGYRERSELEELKIEKIADTPEQLIDLL